jgi:flagellar biosynthesis component FlhA
LKEVKSMDTTLAVLMVLGIFVGIPAIIGFAIAGVYIMSDRKVRRAQRAEAVMEAVTAAEDMVTEAKLEQSAEAVADQKTTKTTKVA